jgi:hypothetical protein
MMTEDRTAVQYILTEVKRTGGQGTRRQRPGGR